MRKTGQVQIRMSRGWALLLPFPFGIIECDRSELRIAVRAGLAECVVDRSSVACLVRVRHPMSPLMPHSFAIELLGGGFAPGRISPPFWQRDSSWSKELEMLGWSVSPSDPITHRDWFRATVI